MRTSFPEFATSLGASLLAGLFLTGASAAAQSPALYGAPTGTANAEIRGAVLSLSNQKVQAQWSVAEGKLTGLKLVVRSTGAQVALPHDPFTYAFKDGTSVRASGMTITDGPQIETLPSNSGASRAAEHFAGKAIRLRLEYQNKDYPSKEYPEKPDTKQRVSIVWRAVLRDDSNYVREEISLSSPDSDQPIAGVCLFNGRLSSRKDPPSNPN